MDYRQSYMQKAMQSPERTHYSNLNSMRSYSNLVYNNNSYQEARRYM